VSSRLSCAPPASSLVSPPCDTVAAATPRNGACRPDRLPWRAGTREAFLEEACGVLARSLSGEGLRFALATRKSICFVRRPVCCARLVAIVELDDQTVRRSRGSAFVTRKALDAPGAPGRRFAMYFSAVIRV